MEKFLVQLSAAALCISCSSESNVGPDSNEDEDFNNQTPMEKNVCNPIFNSNTPGLEGVPLDATLACQTEMNPDELSFKVENLPEGATFDAESRKINWIPSLNQSGAHPIQVSIDSLEAVSYTHLTLPTICSV